MEECIEVIHYTAPEVRNSEIKRNILNIVVFAILTKHRMISKTLLVLHCIALCSGSYYEPPASVCPTKVDFKVVDVEVTVPQYKIVTDGPYTDLDCHIQNAVVTHSVTATKVVLSTTTVPLYQVTFTKVYLEKSPLVITQTQVKTVTKVLENTDINIVTVTATNYHTHYQTKVYTETSYAENKWTTTLYSDVPSTNTKYEYSTYYITQSPVITTEITQYVPYTQAAYVTVKSRGYEITHTSTETKIHTVCPQSQYY